MQKFSSGQKAKLDIDYATSGSYLTPSSIIPTSQLAVDGGLVVGSVNLASFLTQFAPASLTLSLYWGLWVDSKASGADGGTFTSGAWRTRTLNTEVANTIVGASLAANQVTLPAGTYVAWFSAPALQVHAHAVQLYDVTNAAVLARGVSAFSEVTGGDPNVSAGFAVFTLAGVAAIEVQHQADTTKATTGFGVACSFGDTETYAQLLVVKVA